MTWFDRSGLLYSQSTDTGDALNGILNLAFLVLLQRKTYVLSTNQNNYAAFQYIQRVLQDGGHFSTGIEKNWREDRASHDDVTGMVAHAKMNGKTLKFKTLPYLYRPGDFALYNYHQERKFLLPALSLKLFISCARDYYAKNGKRETDGKLLAWLILETHNFPLTKRICYYFIEKHFGKKWLSSMMTVKYEEGHPLLMLARIHDNV